MRSLKKISKSFKKLLSTRKDVEIPAFLGNLAGTVKADNDSNVYVVLFNGEVVTVRNVRVPNVSRLPVVIGYDASNPTLLQVIRARNTFVNPTYPDVPEHSAATHQWPNPDVLWVRGEQIMPGLAIPSALTVEFVGFVYYLSGWHLLENQTIDLSGEVPASGANYVLVEVDNAGAITFNAGTSVASREVLTHDDIPTPTANKMPLFAVKVYVGQTEILKSLLQSDIVDLRWSNWSAGGGGGAWGSITGTLADQTDLQAALDGKVPYTVLIDSKDPTGWVDPSAITVSYDSAARTITLTGTLEYYWRGVKTTLTSPWTSSAHTATNGGWFLSSTDGTNFTWSTTAWTFDVLMVAFVNYGATYKFALRETHSLMQWQTHEELHSTIGTYKESGGTLSNYTLLSTTAANRRPDVAATHLHDEDNETTNAALTSKLYNKLYLAGSTPTITYTGETADIVPLLVNNPYYNAYAAPNWQQTLMANNSYMCVWLVAIPTAADVTSQTYRYTWIQGQSNTNLAGQTALTPSDLNLAAFATEATEFVFLAKIIIRYTGGNWDLNSVTTLTGNRMIQVGSPAGAYLSSVATDATLTGDGSLASPLSVVQSYQLADADLTAIAGLTPANDDVIQRKAGAWINRTIAQLVTDIRTVIDSVFAPIAKGVTNGDSHDHIGGDGAQIAHTGLSSIGTNTHTQIDTHIANTSNPHSVTAAQVALAQSSISPTTADQTAAVNTQYFANISGLTADRNFVIPTGTAKDVIELSLTVGDATYAYIIKGAATVTINGGTAATEWSRLFITGECVKLVATSSTNWQVVIDGRIPASGEIQNTGSQTFNITTDTKVTLDELVFDNCSMTDTTNSKILIRRTGKYAVTLQARLSTSNIADQNTLYLYDDLSTVKILNVAYFPTGVLPMAYVAGEVFLTAGHYEYFYLFQKTTTPSVGTYNGGGQRQFMSLVEII